MTEQKICFTVESNATGLDIKSVKIDDENLIDVSMILTDKNVDVIANKIQKSNGVPQIALGGSHLTRKSPHNRRRRQSTIRKGHRSSRSKGKSKSRR